MMKKKDAIAAAADAQTRLVRFPYCDPAGVIRGKTVHASEFPSKIYEGVGLTRAQNAVNLFEDLIQVEGMEPVGEVRIIPDPNTYTDLPWLDRTAGMFSDLREQDGSEWGGCTRTILKRAIAKAQAQGIKVMAAFESEFYLAQMFRNVYLDVGLAINYAGARSPAIIAESLELAPFSKILFSSDAWGLSELTYLGALLFRRGLGELLDSWVARGDWSAADAIGVVESISRGNAEQIYGLAR